MNNTMEWSEPPLPQNGGTPTIKNHTVTHHNGLLYCFGGYDGRANHMTLMVYSLENQCWNRVYGEDEDPPPPPRRQQPPAAIVPGGDGAAAIAAAGVARGPNNASTNNNRNRRDPQRYNQILPTNRTFQSYAAAAAASNSQRHLVMNHNNNNVNNDEVNANNNMHPDIDVPMNQNNNHQNEPSSPINGHYVVTGEAPPGRNGHTATLAKRLGPEGDVQTCIFIIGGWLGSGPLAASDMHILDISSPNRALKWIQPSANENNDNTHGGDGEEQEGGERTAPGPCNMHSADFVPSRNEIYLFRGGNGREYLNDLHAFNVQDMTWRVVESSGEIPQQRANHSSAFLEQTQELFIFGGWNGRERLNDIHILDTKTSTWSRPHVGGALPHPRAGMTLTAVRDHLYLFGGSGTSSKCFQDLHVLDRKEMTWLDVVPSEPSTSSMLASAATVPHSGSNNSAMVLDDPPTNYFSDDNPMSENDDTTMNADPLNTRQHVPLAEWGKTDSMMTDDGDGGAANPNETESVPTITIRGKGPGRRAGHTATAVNRFIFIFGGSCGSDYLNDFFVLDTDPPGFPEITQPTSIQLFGKRLKYFCNREEFSDVIFLVEGRKVYGHKIILSLVSDFYRAMFSAGFRERTEKCVEIEIPNCSYDSFLTMLEYVYTGEDPRLDVSLDMESTAMGNSNSQSSNLNSIEQVVELLILADQYFLYHLKQLCERKLQPVVNADTVDDLLQVALKTNSIQLESACKHFERNFLTR